MKRKYQALCREAELLTDKLVAYRRDFHKHAETGWLEMRTSSLVARRLADLGYEVLVGRDVCKAEGRMGLPSGEVLEAHYQWAKEHGADPEFVGRTRGGFTGVIGILRCGEGPVVAMRFDMDALGVFEESGEEHIPARDKFCSITEGSMHACGHDGHTTIGLGTAELLAGMRDRLHGTVKLIFQPAEEGVRGSQAIVENGHLDHVDYVLAAHIMPSPDEGCYVCPGISGMYATTKLDAYFTGRSAHSGVNPNDGKNALLAASTAVLNIQAIPRHADGGSRINVGTLHAGTGRNVVCDRAKMEIEVRGETTEINTYMEQYARRILKTAAEMHECGLEIKMTGQSAALKSSPELAKHIRNVCEEKLELPVKLPGKLGGSEDFACMAKHVTDQGGKACFTGIEVPCAASLHNSSFDFDEYALVLGVKYFAGMALNLLGGRSSENGGE